MLSTPRSEELQAQLRRFMHECVYPNEAVYEDQLKSARDHHAQPDVMFGSADSQSRSP